MRSSSYFGVAVILVLALLLPDGVALADVVGPPAEDCPDGAHGETCHGGPFCAVFPCSEEGTCRDGLTCRELRLCIADFDCTSGYGTFIAEQVTGHCAGDTPCATGTCQVRRVCSEEGTVEVDADIAEDADTPSDADTTADAAPDAGVDVRTWGCGCRVSPSEAGAGAVPVLFCLLFIFVRRSLGR